MSLQETVLLLFCCALAWGYDIFEGLLPGAPCFEPRKMIGCHGTLLDTFRPRSQGVGINPPNTTFFLFTPSSKNKPEFLHECGGKLPQNTKFDPSINTEVFVHGWLDGACRTAWMREMKDQLYIRGDYNVLLVDWTWGNIPDYYSAGHNTKVVGEQVAFVIQNILNISGTTADKIHIIGHSFGATIAGLTGKHITSPRKIRRITGLDPALAPLKYAPDEDRLVKTDAELVDVIHSNGGDCFLYSTGDSRTMGHADFYPNGGLFQLPSCLLYGMQSILKLDVFYGAASADPVICSHLHSIQFYKVSINPDGCEFVGVECENYNDFQSGRCRKQCKDGGSNCAIMGMNFELYNAQNKQNLMKNHKYYLDTGLLCPFCDNSALQLNGFPPAPGKH